MFDLQWNEEKIQWSLHHIEVAMMYHDNDLNQTHTRRNRADIDSDNILLPPNVCHRMVGANFSFTSAFASQHRRIEQSLHKLPLRHSGIFLLHNCVALLQIQFVNYEFHTFLRGNKSERVQTHIPRLICKRNVVRSARDNVMCCHRHIQSANGKKTINIDFICTREHSRNQTI